VKALTVSRHYAHSYKNENPYLAEMYIGDIKYPDKPIFLAPMEDVTDSAFRVMCKRGGADMMYTEFISSEALIREAEKSVVKMEFTEEERPFGIQIFGGREEAMHGAAKIAEANKPDLVDINFGCPVFKVVNKNAGSACLRDLGLMERMAASVVDAVSIPVTVKTRLGWDDDSIRIREVALMLQSLGIKAITVHARTRQQGYKGQARWEYLKYLKDTPGLHIPIIGNGDITTPEEAKHVFDTTGVDGIMVGRAAIGNPWVFAQMKHYMDQNDHLSAPTLQERLQACVDQLRLSVQLHGERKGITIMKKHYGNYLKGVRGGKQLRISLMDIQDVSSLEERILNFKEEEFFAVGL
jgi:tRNA-dihydrouridine synthase B